jgi:hypothetical protein
MRLDLASDPAALRMAAACEIPTQHVVGALHAVWSWFDRHTPDGRAPGLDGAFIDQLAGVPGFAKVMEQVGWLSVTGASLSIPKFNVYMSQSAKRRALTARRTAAYRKRKRDARSVTEASPQNRTAEYSREEKKRENSAVSSARTTQARRNGRRDGGPTLLGRCSSITQDPADPAAANPTGTRFNIQQLLADRGCGVEFRGVVARRAQLRLIRELAGRFDERREQIQNPGGWWRAELRRAGVNI